jgi:hypothetical protein
MKVFISGSLRNAAVPHLGNVLRSRGCEVFDDWFGCGPEADDKWKEYEEVRGRKYVDALYGHAARNVFALDFNLINAADVIILVLPAGRSGHLELGYALGQGKKGYILLPADHHEQRWDVMYLFADGVFEKEEELVEAVLNGTSWIGDLP